MLSAIIENVCILQIPMQIITCCEHYASDQCQMGRRKDPMIRIKNYKKNITISYTTDLFQLKCYAVHTRKLDKHHMKHM